MHRDDGYDHGDRQHQGRGAYQQANNQQQAAEEFRTASQCRHQHAGFQPYRSHPARCAFQAIWKGRKGVFSAVGRLSPDYIVQDGVVPRSRLGDALAEIEKLSRETGLRVANVFHAGDGNLHPLILYDNSQPGELERAEKLAGRILRLCVELGGSITGEHGVGVEKLEYLPEMFNEVDLQVMNELREAFDPAQLCNPGKMLGPTRAITRSDVNDSPSRSTQP